MSELRFKVEAYRHACVRLCVPRMGREWCSVQPGSFGSFVSSTFYKAASAPDWTSNIFTMTGVFPYLFVLPFMRLRLVSIIAKARNPLGKKNPVYFNIKIASLWNTSGPCPCLSAVTLPLMESSFLPFDTSSAFQTLVHKSLPIWKERGCTCSPGVRLYRTPYSSCSFIKISLLVHGQWDPGMINSCTGFYSTEKWDCACRSRQMNQLMLFLALEEILALYNLRPQT